MRSCQSVVLELTHSPPMKWGMRTSETAVAHIGSTSAIVKRREKSRVYLFPVKFSATLQRLKERVAVLPSETMAIVKERRFLPTGSEPSVAPLGITTHNRRP